MYLLAGLGELYLASELYSWNSKVPPPIPPPSQNVPSLGLVLGWGWSGRGHLPKPMIYRYEFGRAGQGLNFPASRYGIPLLGGS